MKLLNKKEYDFVEEILKNYERAVVEEPFIAAKNEIEKFFNVPIYKEFLKLFYFERHNYKNRYPDNRSMLRYLCKLLFVQENTLYMVRKEIIYKSAMIFYKYNILK